MDSTVAACFHCGSPVALPPLNCSCAPTVYYCSPACKDDAGCVLPLLPSHLALPSLLLACGGSGPPPARATALQARGIIPATRLRNLIEFGALSRLVASLTVTPPPPSAACAAGLHALRALAAAAPPASLFDALPAALAALSAHPACPLVALAAGDALYNWAFIVVKARNSLRGKDESSGVMLHIPMPPCEAAQRYDATLMAAMTGLASALSRHAGGSPELVEALSEPLVNLARGVELEANQRFHHPPPPALAAELRGLVVALHHLLPPPVGAAPPHEKVAAAPWPLAHQAALLLRALVQLGCVKGGVDNEVQAHGLSAAVLAATPPVALALCGGDAPAPLLRKLRHWLEGLPEEPAAVLEAAVAGGGGQGSNLQSAADGACVGGDALPLCYGEAASAASAEALLEALAYAKRVGDGSYLCILPLLLRACWLQRGPSPSVLADALYFAGAWLTLQQGKESMARSGEATRAFAEKENVGCIWAADAAEELCEALAGRGVASAPPHLRTHLWLFTRAFSSWLGVLGAPSVFSAEGVTASAGRALRALEAAAPALVAVACGSDVGAASEAAALAALQSIGAPCIPGLAAMLSESPNPRVRAFCAKALLLLGERAERAGAAGFAEAVPSLSQALLRATTELDEPEEVTSSIAHDAAGALLLVARASEQGRGAVAAFALHALICAAGGCAGQGGVLLAAALAAGERDGSGGGGGGGSNGAAAGAALSAALHRAALTAGYCAEAIAAVCAPHAHGAYPPPLLVVDALLAAPPRLVAVLSLRCGGSSCSGEPAADECFAATACGMAARALRAIARLGPAHFAAVQGSAALPALLAAKEAHGKQHGEGRLEVRLALQVLGMVDEEDEVLVLRHYTAEQLAKRLKKCLSHWKGELPCDCGTAQMCPICYEEEECAALTSFHWLGLECGHIFHERCLLSWLATRTKEVRQALREGQHPAPALQNGGCPICRGDIVAKKIMKDVLPLVETVVATPMPLPQSTGEGALK